MSRTGQSPVHQPEDCERCKANARERYALFVRSVRKVLSLEEGRRVLDFILDQTGMNELTLYRHGAEINAVVARRDLGCSLERMIFTADPQGGRVMREERYAAADLEVARHEQHENELRKER